MDYCTCDPAGIEMLKTDKSLYYDKVEMVKLHLSYPSIKTGKKGADRRINAYYEHEAHMTAKRAEKVILPSAIEAYKFMLSDGAPFFTYDVRLDVTEAFNEGRLLSTYSDSYEYTGGAHGMTARNSITWNTETGYPVTLKELSGRKKGACARTLAMVEERAEVMYRNKTLPLFDDYKKLIRKSFDCESFYLSPEGVQIYFQLYAIAPYYAGIIAFTLPFEALFIPLPCPE